MIQYYF